MSVATPRHRIPRQAVVRVAQLALAATGLTARADELAAAAAPSTGHALLWTLLGIALVAALSAGTMMRVRARAAQPSLAAFPQLTGLSSDGFKQLVADTYRRGGYEVREAGDAAADADLIVSKDARHSLVLCRHWQRGKVGMRQVRALYGAMAAHSAQTGVVITAGSFVADAFRFAGLGHIELIDHAKLAGFLGVKSTGSANASMSSAPLRAGAA